MITLYTFGTPNGQKASIMLEETGVPYQVHKLDMMGREHRQPAYMAISPIGKLPAMVDHGAGDRRVFGSGAILIYLAELTSKLLPTDPAQRTEAFNWLAFGISDLGPTSIDLFRFAVRAPEKLPYAIDLFKGEITRCWDALEQRLTEADYLAGHDYSIADISVVPFIAAKMQSVPTYFDERPGIKRWFEAVSTRPAVEKGLKVPG